MLRDHHSRKCEEVMKLWKEEIIKGSHRDQLSFTYACWKLGFRYGHLNEDYRVFKATNHFNLLKHSSGKAFPEFNRYSTVLGIVIINYNTNDLTNALIKSIKKTVKCVKYDIIVFDNSTYEKFQCPEDVVLIDNSHLSLINFDRIIS